MNASIVVPEPAVWEVLLDTLEGARRVIDGDVDGRVVTTDLYALGLRAATKHNVHPVRMWTAVIDIAFGMRDYLRGPKRVEYPNVTPWIPGSVVE